MIPSSNELSLWVSRHLKRYPLCTAQDIYKMIFQAVRGPEHLLDSPERVLESILAEMNSLAGNTSEELWEELGNGIYRIHLRPFRLSGEDSLRIAAACIETARQVISHENELEETWGLFQNLHAGGLAASITGEDVSRLTDQLEVQGYPPVHHSPAFRAAYRPAYRVLSQQIYLNCNQKEP